ncbi:MAG: hypothetical protein KatS3mg042_1334 [Rhodothermaceae bacterium]|nr:MAG: hypothetical protein KatS3mg042_1334 [Rhodothermaceae bacterium]
MTDRLSLPDDLLDRLYAMARLLAASDEAAADLVAATLRQAAAAPAPPSGRPAERVWLFHLLLQQHRAGLPPGVEAPDRPAEAPFPLRAHLAHRYIDRMVPVVFANLPGTDRLLLALCDLEHFSCMEAAVMLNLDAETACARREAAHAKVVQALREAATPPERRLLDALPGDPQEWLPDALARTLTPLLLPASPALRQRLKPLAEASAPPPPRPAPPRGSVRRRHPLRSALVGLTLILAAGLTGYGLSALIPAPAPPETDLIQLTARSADPIEPAFHTPSPEQAERYLRDRLGWRLTIPTIDEALLLGVGQRTLASGVEVPVLLYEDIRTAEHIPVYAFSYAFLDRHRERLTLARDILRQIEREHHFDLHDLGDRQVLVWRYRDDIFVAVTPRDAAGLRDRIHYPS